jgi:hypothetical protein
VAGLAACLEQLGPWCAAAALAGDLLGASEGQGGAGELEQLLASKYGQLLEGEELAAEGEASAAGVRWVGRGPGGGRRAAARALGCAC